MSSKTTTQPSHRYLKKFENLQARKLRKGETMLGWTVFFLIIALIAALLGFGGIAGTAAGIAKLLFVIFLAVFFISLLTGLVRRRP
jgi:uncharacterized membrane protein YtjA (UPF0391 family)